MHAIMVTAALVLGVQGVGDKSIIQIDSTLVLDITVLDGNGKSERKLTVERSERFAQEVLSVAEGRPNAVKIKCESSIIQKSGLAPFEQTDSPLSGRTYTATFREKGWEVRDANGTPPPASGQALGTWNDVSRLLPDEKLKTGAKWEVPVGEIAALIFPSGLVEGKGRIDCSCRALSGGRATIAFEGEITEGKALDSSLVNMSFKGDFVYDVGAGRPISLSVKEGSITILREIIEEYRRPNENTIERIKVGDVSIKSRQLSVDFTFE